MHVPPPDERDRVLFSAVPPLWGIDAGEEKKERKKKRRKGNMDEKMIKDTSHQQTL